MEIISHYEREHLCLSTSSVMHIRIFACCSLFIVYFRRNVVAFAAIKGGVTLPSRSLSLTPHVHDRRAGTRVSG